jgi:hypothetical protein
MARGRQEIQKKLVELGLSAVKSATQTRANRPVRPIREYDVPERERFRTSAIVLSQRTRIRGQPRLSCRHEEAEGEVLQPRWGVYRLGGKRAERMLFTVTARDAEQAIEENQIPERERWRISVAVLPHQPSIDVLAQPSSFGTARLCWAKHLSYLLPGGGALRLRGIARYSQYAASLEVNDDYQNPHDAVSFLGAEGPHYNSQA